MDEATARYRVVFADEAAEKLKVEQEAAQNSNPSRRPPRKPKDSE
jgi:hypothetical protein